VKGNRCFCKASPKCRTVLGVAVVVSAVVFLICFAMPAGLGVAIGAALHTAVEAAVGAAVGPAPPLTSFVRLRCVMDTYIIERLVLVAGGSWFVVDRRFVLDACDNDFVILVNL
jgi:hypothetical protein